MNSLIVTAEESKAFIDGSKTAFVAVVKPQPLYDKNIAEDVIKSILKGRAPFSLNQEIYLREPWAEIDNIYEYKTDACRDAPGGWDNISADERPAYARWKPGSTMPKSAARTWLRIVGVDVLRVQEILSISSLLYPLTGGKNGIECGQILYQQFTAKYGQISWDFNPYVFYVSVQLLNTRQEAV